MTDQYQLTSHFCSKPQQFAWFLGAGTSAAAGLPTAADIIWDLKRRFYCREENQDISRQDVQLEAVRSRIQAYMLSRGFPQEGAPGEYTTYFEKAFGDDKERQRQYVIAVLSEKNVTLSVGSRIFAALLATGRTRAVFTTNFDSVVERAFAEISGRSISPHHLEGATSANKAINSEEFPFYCKLHGDFRHDSLKNLQLDLQEQNSDLSKSLVNAANRFGFIVAGYSGRDQSVMQLLRSALSTPNPFPHGLFWTSIKNSKLSPAVESLLDDAKQAGVNAAFVEIETFDTFMLRLWRNLEGKDPIIDAKIRKASHIKVNIPLPGGGKGPIIRLNALPILDLPDICQSLIFKHPKEWADLRVATNATEGELLFTKSDVVLCWGQPTLIRNQFKDIVSISPYNLSQKIAEIGDHLHIKGFLEEALCHALIRGKPLLTRTTRTTSYIICNPHHPDQSTLDAMHSVVGKFSGQIAGMFTPVDESHPHPERVHWAEAIRISIDIINGKGWLLLDPDIWIWPPRARKAAATFLSDRRSDRYNKIYNALIDAWLNALFGDGERKPEISISAHEYGAAAENPTFRIGLRTAYTRGLA